MSSMSYRGRENRSQTRITWQLTGHIRRHPESDPDIPHRASGSADARKDDRGRMPGAVPSRANEGPIPDISGS